MPDYPNRSNDCSSVSSRSQRASELAAALSAGDDIAQSWLKFASDRMAKDADFPRQLTKC